MCLLGEKRRGALVLCGGQVGRGYPPSAELCVAPRNAPRPGAWRQARQVHVRLS